MKVKHIRYVVTKKTTGEFLARESGVYSDGELCNEIEYADFWLDDDDAAEYIKNILDEPELFETMKVVVEYKIGWDN